METKKVAGIWARVSTSGQTSLPDQIGRAKEKLEQKGYIVPADRILAVDWTSLDLFSCPEFQRLISWVKRQEIQGLGILDRDRLQAEGVQRLTFLAECRDAGVDLVICQGPELIDGDEGQLIELALSIGKKRSVLRAKQGAKDGMHDKVVRDRKPTSRHRIYGYRWETDTRLVPTEDWDTAKLILDLVLKGIPYRQIVKQLKKGGILSPNGSPEWEPSTISSVIVRNPVYAGRYYALGKYVCQPQKRKANRYGNTSVRTVPLEQRVYLPEVEVVNPPINWEQFLQIQQRIRKNQQLAQRNAKHDYLLRGIIFCETHYGKKGEPRIYFGHPANGTYYYQCPVGGCKHPNLNGAEIEREVKNTVQSILNLEPDEFYERIANRQSKAGLEQSLDKELKSLEAKYNRNLNAETELERKDLLGQLHPEVYRRIKSQLQAERIWIEERKQAITDQLAQLGREAEAVESLQQIRASFKNRLDDLTDDEWRQLFIALNLEIHIRDIERKSTWRGEWFEEEERQEHLRRFDIYEPDTRDEIEVTIGIPMTINTGQIKDIVFEGACPSPSS